MYFIILYWTEPWYRASVNGLLISDKDCNERVVFTKELPGICLQLCLFHVLRSFRREITCDKMGIRAGERDHALEILSKLAYARSESDYNRLYDVRMHMIVLFIGYSYFDC